MTLDDIKQEMCRELAEEMGVEALPSDMTLWTIVHDASESEIKFLFVAQVARPSIRIDPAEVTGNSGWYDPPRLQELLAKERFVKPVSGLWEVLLQNQQRFGDFVRGIYPWQPTGEWCDGLKAFKSWRETRMHEGNGSREADRVPLFLGRFQPFHLGHLKCLAQIARQSRNVIIGIGSAQYSRDGRNPLTLAERRDLIEHAIARERLDFENVFFVPILDVHDEGLWMLNVKLLLDDAVRLYSNNDWVRGLASAARMDVAKKMEFEMGTYNGSRIRELLREGAKWQELVPDPQFMVDKGLVSAIKRST